MFQQYASKTSAFLAMLLVCIFLTASPAFAKGNYGETFTCFFPKSGKVLIDTREPNSSVTYKGRRYKASGGSYFYQTDADITLGFNSSMTKWTIMFFGKNGSKSEKSTRCSRTKNRR